MSFLLLRRKCVFTLSMLKDGDTISKKQYDSLYSEIYRHFSIYTQRIGDRLVCKIRRETVMGTRELFGRVYNCPIPTSNNETFTFYIEN